MGWVDRELPNLFFVLELPLKAGVLSEYPAAFFVLESPSNYYHGMREIETLIRNAKRHAAWDSKRIAFWARNPYRAVLHRISKVNRNR